jgi:DNA-binding LacI/PurR family transcriptional regulator
MESLNVQRRVIRLAIAQLEEEGLLTRQPNCRPIVQASSSAEGSFMDIRVDASRLVALVMFHGGILEEPESAQKRIFWGINQALGRAGRHAIFLDLGTKVGTPEENAAAEAAHLRYAMENEFGGIAFYAYAYKANRDLIREVSSKIPLVLIDRTIPGVDTDFVGIQNHQAMFDATKYLIALGHRRIAYVTTAEPINTVQDRLQGYMHALHDGADGEVYEMIISIPFVGKYWPIFETVFRLPASERPTAVVCVNDYEAVRVTERLAYLNLKVPDDVSIIGCDNIVDELPGGIGLTTIAQPFEGIGEEAAQLLIKRSKSPNSLPITVELPSQLVIRQSARQI